jgi:hypothetical protein
MMWELYEIWSADDNGHEQLVDTTKSRKEAKQLAKRAINEGASEVWICREASDGDYEEIERFATN